MADNTIDLDAIRERCRQIDRLRKSHPWVWPENVSEPIKVALEDRTELLAEVERLRQEQSENNAFSLLEQKYRTIQAVLDQAERERDEWWTEVKQLRRELREERVQRDEWEKMNNRLIAGTEVEHLQERLGQVKTALSHEVDSRVRAELEVEWLQAMRVTKRQRLTEQGIRINRFEAALASTQEDLAETRAELDRMRGDMQEQSDEVQELWLSPCEAEGLRRQLAEMETVARLHEHALNERDEALAAEHQLRRETKQCYRAALAMAQNRGDRLERAEALAALVTPELAALLEKVSDLVGGDKGWTSIGHFTSQDGERCHTLAARIREALEEVE